jgi:hypothetical protein
VEGKTALLATGSIGPGWGNGKATPVTFTREAAQVLCVDRNSAAGKEPAVIFFPRRYRSECCGMRRFLRFRVFIWCGFAAPETKG